ncbi:hypothetical protein ILUMI_06985 [Ignelater luminosus]|uniref:Uncharacterized protein n=1 Tax=Ignelater luminosus TaxID=2038154 RepID=A0A8K0D4C6_IGNLU|nr:hypothetical protein ILUMI_06985 [Ignelater luminosus]
MEILENDVKQNEEKEDSDEEFDSIENEIEESEEEYVPAGENKVPILFTQNDLNNLIRRYAMPKDASEDLISELKSRNLVVPGTREPEKDSSLVLLSSLASCVYGIVEIVEITTKKQWPQRVALNPGEHNVIEEPLLDSSKILLPSLHIKLGLIKQCVKALDKRSKWFRYIVEQFPELSNTRLKKGTFSGPQIRKMLRNKKYIATMTNTKKAT